jgi:hypothetical protein
MFLPGVGVSRFRNAVYFENGRFQVTSGSDLSQVQNGVERPLSFASRQMNKAEQNYSASEAEMLERGQPSITDVTCTGNISL